MNGIVTNHSTCGTIKLDGNWINNSTNTCFVIFEEGLNDKQCYAIQI